MTRMDGRARQLPRWSLVSLAVVTVALAYASPAGAQVQRQATGTVASTQLSPAVVQAMVDPLKTEVDALRVQVNRLQAALASLRLTVQANQAAFTRHRHGVAHYGLITAKAISPSAPDIQLPFTAPGTKKEGFTGLPE